MKFFEQATRDAASRDDYRDLQNKDEEIQSHRASLRSSGSRIARKSSGAQSGQPWAEILPLKDVAPGSKVAARETDRLSHREPGRGTEPTIWIVLPSRVPDAVSPGMLLKRTDRYRPDCEMVSAGVTAEPASAQAS